MGKQISFKKSIIIQISVSLAIIVAFLVLIVFINVDVNRRISEIEDFKSNLEESSRAIGLLAELRDEADRAEPLVATLEKRLPSIDELVLFPRELEKIAKENFINLGFTFGSETAGSDSEPGAVSFTMSLSGSYENLTSFLSAVENSRYYIRMGSVDITRRAAENFGLVTSGEVYIRSNGETDIP